MKKRLLSVFVLALFALCSTATKSNAQITGVTLDSVQIYTQTNCLLPSSVNVSYNGGASGTLTTTDSVTIYLNFGDGTDTTFKVGFPQGNWYWGFLYHTYTIAGNIQVMGTASANGFTDTFYSNIITLSNSCAPLSGRLYVDANNDCIYQSGEIVVSNSSVTIHDNVNNQNYYTMTNASGQYTYGVPPGNYTITPGSAPGASVACPSSGSVTVTVTTGGSYNNDFAFACSTTPVDLSVSAYAGNWRLGFDRPMHLTVASNSMCTNASGTLSITLPSDLSYSGVAPGSPAPTVSGNTLTWNISNLNASNTWWNSVLIHTALTATFGDTLCVSAIFTPSVPDANAANNISTVCAQVNNSYDPNDKRVSPEGNGPQGNILNSTMLTYLVRFQNTGNDVAYTVTVKDLIDSDLDINSMRVLKTSHPMTLSFTGREAAFRFDNINLPDSASDEPASHGFILYTIAPKANLALGTTLTNTADIYFDFNDPIITNTTLNTIASPQSVQHLSNGSLEAMVFPNPANGNLYIEVSEKGSYKAEVFDMLGRSVQVVNSFSGKTTLDVKGLTSGLYLLKLTDNTNKTLSTKINIQH